MQVLPSTPDATRANGATPAADQSPLAGALYMATTHGVPVFPLRPGTKYPYKGEGVRVATTDVLQIMDWAADRPDCNFGGSTAGFAVIDVDIKAGGRGFDTLDALCKSNGALPETLQIATASGGLHIYFKADNIGQAGLGDNVDVRGMGGYVLLRGSAVEGKRYKLAHAADVAAAPDRWQSLFSRPRQRKETDRRDIPLVELDTEEAISRATAYLESRPGASEPGRNSTGFPIACHMRDLGLSQDMAAELLAEYWGDRCSPPLDAEECAGLAYNAYRYAQNPAPGNLHSESDFKDVADALESDTDDHALDTLAELIDEIPPKPAAPEDRPAQPLNPADQFEPWDTAFAETDLKPRPWIMRNMLMRGQLTALLAHPGVGKSSLSLALTVAAARGDGDLVGFPVPKSVGPAKVVLLTVEESREELNARLWAYCKLHSIDRASLSGRVYVQKISADGIALVRANKVTRNREITEAYKRLAALVSKEKIDVIVFDPFVELHDADENDNNAIADVIKAVRALCRHYRAAGLVVHHTRKAGASGASTAGDMHSARGAGSFIGAVRLAYTLTYPTDDDAERYGMTAAERGRCIRLDNAKVNYGPRGAEPTWYQFASVAMPFATPEGDEPEYTGALSLIDFRGRKDTELRAVFAALRDELASAGLGGITIEYAAKVCMMADRTLFGTQPAAIAKRLRRVFKSSQEINGQRISLEGTGKKSALKMEETDAEDFAE